MLHYFRADTLTGRWANVEALTCSCPVCDGRSLDRFDSDDTGVEVQARAHNSAVWAALWAQMQALPTETERRRWLAERIRHAYEAYEAENGRIQQARAFKPSKTLERLATVVIVAVRAFGLSRGVLRYAERLRGHGAALRVLAGLQARCYAALVRVAPAGLRGGDLAARFAADVDAAADVLVRAVLPLLVATVVTAGSVALLAALVPTAGGVLLATAAAALVARPP